MVGRSLCALVTLLGSGVATAAPLALGDTVWMVDGGSLSLPTTTVVLDDGYAFSVTDARGRPQGMVVVGPVAQVVHGGAPLATALHRELGLTDGVDPGGDWSVAGDVAIVLGAAAQLPEHWHRVVIEDGVALDLDAPDPETILVRQTSVIAAARREATQALHARESTLAGLGYSLSDATVASPSPQWGLLDVRTSVVLGGLAGNRSGPGDRWLLSVAADPVLPAGVGAASLVGGLRRVDLKTDC